MEPKAFIVDTAEIARLRKSSTRYRFLKLNGRIYAVPDEVDKDTASDRKSSNVGPETSVVQQAQQQHDVKQTDADSKEQKQKTQSRPQAQAAGHHGEAITDAGEKAITNPGLQHDSTEAVVTAAAIGSTKPEPESESETESEPELDAQAGPSKHDVNAGAEYDQIFETYSAAPPTAPPLMGPRKHDAEPEPEPEPESPQTMSSEESASDSGWCVLTAADLLPGTEPETSNVRDQGGRGKRRGWLW